MREEESLMHIATFEQEKAYDGDENDDNDDGADDDDHDDDNKVGG